VINAIQIDKHRKAAQLMAKGMSLVEISREARYGPNYWSRLKNGSPVFQDALAYYRRQAEQAWVSSLERVMMWPFIERWEGHKRARRPVG
jgi:hypothetical protein